MHSSTLKIESTTDLIFNRQNDYRINAQILHRIDEILTHLFNGLWFCAFGNQDSTSGGLVGCSTAGGFR